jgi:hypothetical protein
MARAFLAAALLASLFSEPAAAATTIDAEGDLLSTYVGQVGTDLDILEFSVAIDGSNFVLFALLNGAVGTTPLSRYNIGVNRGAGTNRFGEAFRPGTRFDTTINLVPVGPTGEIRNFGLTDVVTPLDPTAITVQANSISVIVPFSRLPTTGFTSENYTFLLWSRTNVMGAPNTLGIADFAPDSGTLSAVPEPATWAMLLIGFCFVGGAMRSAKRRHKLTVSYY